MTKQRMKSLIHNLLLIILLLPLCGCFQDFEPDIPSTPVVCLNSLITEGEPIEITVTRTWRWSEGNYSDKIAAVFLKDAVVKMFVNGSFKETLQYKEVPPVEPYEDTRMFFYSDYRPAIGDTIRFEASSRDYGDATAEVTVPERVDITKVIPVISNMNKESNKDMTYMNYSFDLSMKVSFTDPADKVNYYIFDLDETHPMGHIEDKVYISPDYYEWISAGFDVELEPLFSEHVAPLESIISESYGWTVFSDRQIEGRPYSLNIVCTESKYKYDATANPDKAGHEATLNVRLYNISQSYYDFMISLWQSEKGITGALGGIGLGNPVWEKSNVSTGAGVVAARTASVVRLNDWELVNGGY